MRILKTAWTWIDRRLGISALIVPLATHPVPPDTGWWYVFGSATLFAFSVQVVTGVGLALSYVSSSGSAYEALQYISHEAPLGRLLRGMHYFGASAMVFFVGIHALRVFLFGSYKFPRELNWITGVLLLGLTLVMGFTGQILRWDQTAIWSMVVASEQAGRVPLVGGQIARLMIGGGNIGALTLSRIFAIHVFIVPALILAMVGVHLQLVLHNGISEPPKPGQPVDPKTSRQNYEALLEKTGEPFWPCAAWRDIAFGAAMIVIVVCAAFLIGAPELSKPPDPAIIAANPRPDWYLVWYFAVLALMPHAIESVLMVLGPLLAGLWLILMPFMFNGGERHPLRRPQAMAAVVMIVLGIGAFWLAGIHADWSPDFSAKPLSPQVVASANPEVQRGAHLFFSKGCINCHQIQGDGGRRGPDLTDVGDRLTQDQLTIRILTGATNMPAFGKILKPDELEAVVAFLKSRRKNEKTKPEEPVILKSWYKVKYAFPADSTAFASTPPDF